MRRTFRTFATLLLCAIAPSVILPPGSVRLPSADGSELRMTPTVKAVQRVSPSVVNIHGHKTLPADRDLVPGEDAGRRVNGMGTGAIIDPRGYIITNYHVVEGVSRIQVTTREGETFVARLVAHDAKTDLAVIQIPVRGSLPVIPVGTSSDLMAGEPVIAVGNAFGYENTVTEGIISALHRDVPVSDTQRYDDLIQTNASINPGNSGGPLVNIDGEMIGINVAVRVGAQGIGFAIPVDQAMDVAARLLSVERIDRRWHGVEGRSVVVEQSPRFVVQAVQPESPAAKAGLKSGDVVTAVGDLPVVRALDFERGLLGRHPGEEVQFTIERNREPITVSLVMSEAPRTRSTAADRVWETLGLQLDPIPSTQFQQLNSRYRGGLAVVAVRPESHAARQGIRRGDILVGMHVWETISLENVTYVLNRADIEQLQPVKFYILRGNETLYTHLQASLPGRQQ